MRRHGRLQALVVSLGLGMTMFSQGADTVASAASIPAGTITTIAGGIGGPGPATSIGLAPCQSVEVGGHLYITDLSDVREVSTRTDWLTTAAGPVTSDAGRDGGLATSVALAACGITADRTGNVLIESLPYIRVLPVRSGRFYGRVMLKGHIYAIGKIPPSPCSCPASVGIALDHQGNVLFSERGGNKLGVLAESSGLFYGQRMRAGHEYTVAGTGSFGRTGDGGPARKARLGDPTGLVVDRDGNVVFADSQNSRIRVVAGRTGRFYGVRMRRGDIYTIVDRHGVWWKGGFAGDGGPAINATIDRPTDVALDRAGNLLIVDSNNARIRVVAARSGHFYGKAMRAGRIYTVAGDGKPLSGDGVPAVHAGIFPGSVTVDGSGNLVISNLDVLSVVAGSNGTFYGRPMRLGYIYTVAGILNPYPSPLLNDGWIATRAQLGGGDGLAVDGAGNVIDALVSAVDVIAGRSGTFYGRTMVRGHVYLVAGGGDVNKPQNGVSAIGAGIMPMGVAADHDGNLVVTDLANKLVRVIANSSGTFYGQSMSVGDIYTIAGGGSGSASGDGGPATQASLQLPGQVAVDQAGNLVLADDDRVRVLPASSGTYYGQQMTAGDIYTIAGTGVAGFSPDGTVATQALISFVSGLAIDSNGNLVISDQGSNLIRVVAAGSGTFYGRAMEAGRIYTIAGGGSKGLGDGGPARKAELDSGWNVAIDAHGNIVIPDSGRARVVAATSGTFYGVPMVAGDIYTVAGDGTSGFSGDGGPALRASLDFPQTVTIDGAGDLLIGDFIRIRSVTG